MKFVALLFPMASLLSSAEPITYDNLPLGSEKSPLVFRTYMPDPGLEKGYFANHFESSVSPAYNPGTGKDQKGEYKPVKGLPAAIGVNHGPTLSYVFDTVECRIAYAWQGGFLDMYPYWGDPSRGNRLSNNYVPHLVGTLFQIAPPVSEIHVDGKPLTGLGAPRYIGYDMKKGNPVFRFSRGSHEFALEIVPETSTPLSYTFTISSGSVKTITYGAAEKEGAGNTLRQKVTGTAIKNFQGFPRDSKITEATIANGQLLFDSLGCSACHSLDGSVGHGPTLAGLHGGSRLIEGSADPVKADDAYILQSIKEPGAKITKGFPPNYMPPYALKDLEYESLVLFIRSVAKGE